MPPRRASLARPRRVKRSSNAPILSRGSCAGRDVRVSRALILVGRSVRAETAPPILPAVVAMSSDNATSANATGSGNGTYTVYPPAFLPRRQQRHQRHRPRGVVRRQLHGQARRLARVAPSHAPPGLAPLPTTSPPALTSSPAVSGPTATASSPPSPDITLNLTYPPAPGTPHSPHMGPVQRHRAPRSPGPTSSLASSTPPLPCSSPGSSSSSSSASDGAFAGAPRAARTFEVSRCPRSRARCLGARCSAAPKASSRRWRRRSARATGRGWRVRFRRQRIHV